MTFADFAHSPIFINRQLALTLVDPSLTVLLVATANYGSNTGYFSTDRVLGDQIVLNLVMVDPKFISETYLEVDGVQYPFELP